MTNPTSPAVFPFVKATAAVTAAVALAAGVAWFIINAYLPESTVTASVIAMAVAIWLSTVVSLLPFHLVDAKAAANSLLAMYLAGAVLRMLFCLAAIAVAVLAGGLDPKPTALSVLLIYAPAMISEIAFVRGYLRKIFAKPQLESSEALA